jgi:molybdate transport system substrate-binding protein
LASSSSRPGACEAKQRRPLRLAVHAWVLCAAFLSPLSHAANLKVFAAASLTDAFKEIGPAFERGRPGAHVAFNFASSSLLRTQIEQGAPCDLFASADWEQMSPLVRAGKVRDAATFVRNRLAVVIPKNNPAKIRQLADLARPGLRTVMTAEQVPIGRYTRQALAKMSGPGGFGSDFQQKVISNVVSEEANVRSVLAKVELGEADAAILYASDAVAAGPKVRAIAIPTRFNVTAAYPVGVVGATRNTADAAAFARFLYSRSAGEILKRYGFQPR